MSLPFEWPIKRALPAAFVSVPAARTLAPVASIGVAAVSVAAVGVAALGVAAVGVAAVGVAALGVAAIGVAVAFALATAFRSILVAVIAPAALSVVLRAIHRSGAASPASCFRIPFFLEKKRKLHQNACVIDNGNIVHLSTIVST